jgi:7-cyano-7-deazaguanine synthase
MCAIIGAVLRDINTAVQMRAANDILLRIWNSSHERGRDGRGYLINSSNDMEWRLSRDVLRCAEADSNPPALLSFVKDVSIIANLRAEPTTEYVATKNQSDQQPYGLFFWAIVHNGTIANDKELRTKAYPSRIDSAAIVEALEEYADPTFADFDTVVRSFKGSYAILATHKTRPNTIFAAANYRPIWYITTPKGVFFASSRDYFPSEYIPQMLPPYTVAEFDAGGIVEINSLYDYDTQSTALVVCSGGLDSVVSARMAQQSFEKIHLIHFQYGSRAEGPEVKAVQAVAQALGAELTLFPLPVYAKGDSPLLDPDSKIAGGEAGAEFAYEWVPARNLLLLATATAFAEARGYNTIVLGNNLEEAGAYPDNEPEFITRFNDMLPFAVGDGKRMKVIMPVGNLMKHEIVALGHQIGAPMHLTWSCYRAGEQHCGTCGPCYMRRKAFEINHLLEVIEYKDQT